MENKSHELYEKYQADLINKIQDDSFYNYFYNLLDTGFNSTTFINRKLVKTIDEEWVEHIEKALPHIKVVVEKPRTFIEEQREVVNVGKVKKISVESVRHLTQHSEYIDKFDENGIVQPNKLLDVLKEDSYNTYENRFVFSLLKLLKDFVERRMEVLFEKIDDEDGVLLKVDSVVDNYTEVINYKLEMRIREKDIINEDDEDEAGAGEANIFTRLTRVNNEIKILTCSSFYKTMEKYPLVKHPIVKTNAIGKNVDYQACYELWNYIYAYNKVGYKVELVEQDSTINSAFEKDIYDSMMLEYTMLREHMDETSLINLERKRRNKNISVQRIRKFMQELVREYDISESELRLLLLKEYNRAQKEKKELDNSSKKLKRIKAKKNKDVGIQLINDEWESFFTQDEEKVEEEKKVSKKKNKKRELLGRQRRNG